MPIGGQDILATAMHGFITTSAVDEVHFSHSIKTGREGYYGYYVAVPVQNRAPTEHTRSWLFTEPFYILLLFVDLPLLYLSTFNIGFTSPVVCVCVCVCDTDEGIGLRCMIYGPLFHTERLLCKNCLDVCVCFPGIGAARLGRGDRLIGFAGWRWWFAATIRGPYSPECAASRRKLAAGGELVFLPFEAHYNLSGCKFKQILFNASWRSGVQALSIPTKFASKKSNVLQR